MVEFDLDRILKGTGTEPQYERQLKRIQAEGKEVQTIETAVQGAISNLNTSVKSFVIYGEPQSGKTEMMICLTAKLLDIGFDFILHLLNDSVDLLGQNLGRFRDAGIAPTPVHFAEILDPVVRIAGQKHVVFAKKNGNDLTKVINKIGSLKRIVIIDDEADFASPNAKINKGQRTAINEKIDKLLSNDGIYIGVTATPARLDLNNTFDNDNTKWVNFPPHTNYTGQDAFFPIDGHINYRLVTLSDNSDKPEYAREALFRFMLTVAYLNLHSPVERNYSMLIHTSGKKVDHQSDWKAIHSALDILRNKDSDKFERYVRRIWEIAGSLYPDADPEKLAAYVLENISRTSTVVLNSERDKANTKNAASPQTLFTIIIGGNIVSRGVTFDNLLSMFFTRDVKHKLQQDTYVQRARMFGSRNGYIRHFELTIPGSLYIDWQRCFVFHKLALEAIKSGVGSPVWLGDSRISAVAASSIDLSTVDLDRGEMSFPLFKADIEKLTAIAADSAAPSTKLQSLAAELGEEAFPAYLLHYIQNVKPSGDASIAVLGPSSIEGYTASDDINKKAIERRRGFFGAPQMELSRHPNAVHFLKVFYNAEKNGRLFYKYKGSISFIKNNRR